MRAPGRRRARPASRSPRSTGWWSPARRSSPRCTTAARCCSARCTVVPDADEREPRWTWSPSALLPGRTPRSAGRPRRELEATLVLALPIDEWSLKVSDGWPDDPPRTSTGAAWAGVVPFSTGYGAPRPAPDLRARHRVPASVRSAGPALSADAAQLRRQPRRLVAQAVEGHGAGPAGSSSGEAFLIMRHAADEPDHVDELDVGAHRRPRPGRGPATAPRRRRSRRGSCGTPARRSPRRHHLVDQRLLGGDVVDEAVEPGDQRVPRLGSPAKSAAESHSASTSSTYTASSRACRGREVPVQRADADAGPPGDVLERGLGARSR